MSRDKDITKNSIIQPIEYTRSARESTSLGVSSSNDKVGTNSHDIKCENSKYCVQLCLCCCCCCCCCCGKGGGGSTTAEFLEDLTL